MKLATNFPDVKIVNTVCAELSWSPLRFLLGFDDSLKRDFYIDLLFYHRRLKCLVVIDLKLGGFEAAYKGQMELPAHVDGIDINRVQVRIVSIKLIYFDIKWLTCRYSRHILGLLSPIYR